MRIRGRVRGLVPATRRGKVLVMMAGLMPVLVGGVAVSVDTAVLATAKGQLQTVADSAALAGAMQLATESRLRGATDLSPEMGNARAKAIAAASANRVLNAPAVLNDNPANLPTGDVVVGTFAQGGPSLLTATPSLFNSVQVTAYRNSGHTGLVPSFFGSYLGSRGSTLKVSATATVENSTIQGVKSYDGATNANLLPIVMDVPTYYQMLTGYRYGVTPAVTISITDQYTYNPPTAPATVGTVTAGADGVAESDLYPVGTNPGNWGTINVGVSNNSTSILGAQIRYGITPAQLATFPGGTVSLDQESSGTADPLTGQTPLHYHTFSGNPGISAGIKDDLTAIIGKPVVLPIYDQTGGVGDNVTYRVVKFAGVRILAVNFQGNPKYVTIQPALLNDPTVIPFPNRPESSWQYGGLIHLYLSR